MQKVFITLLTSFVLLQSLYSGTIKVPQNIQTIQAAIDSSRNGDTVLVSPGTYLENINFHGKNIVLGSLFLTTGDTSYISQTVIDGNRESCVVVFENGEDTSTVLTGFTVTNGYSFQDSLRGGGITCINSSNPKLNNLKIINNEVVGEDNVSCGGGIFIENSSVQIDSTIIKQNVARSGASKGGGIYAYSSDILIKFCEISYNTAETLDQPTAQGGGIYVATCNIIVENSNIFQNYAEGSGGGIKTKGSNTSIFTTTIANNNCYPYGCGGGISSGSSLYLEDVKILNNSAGDYGGGLCYFPKKTVEILKNVIIKNNKARYGGGLATNQNFQILEFSDCSIFQNRAVKDGADIYVTIQNNNTQNIFYLDTVTVSEPDDFLIKPIQKVEFHYKHAIFQTVDFDLFVSPEGSDSNRGITKEGPLKTIDFALMVAKADSNNHRIINLAPGTYSLSETGENFPLYAKCYTSIVGGDANKTILDGENKTRILESFFSNSITMEGFTIQKGYDNSKGGGLYLSGEEILLKNLIIKDNHAEYLGGGLSIYSSNHVELLNLTIVNNSSSQQKAGGITFAESKNISILNSIITLNSSYNIGLSVSECIIDYSNIGNGKVGIKKPLGNLLHWLEGNIDADPLFIGGEPFDYNLSDNSPSINAGTSLFVWGGDTLINLAIDEYIGDAPDMGALESDILISVERKDELPTEIKLEQNYPNPFNPSTIIKYSIPKSARNDKQKVRLTIYDILGHEIAILIKKIQKPGYYKVEFDGHNLASGIYFYQLKTEGFIKTRKMLLVQ